MNLCLSGDGCFEPAVPSNTFPGKYRFCEGHQARLDAVKEHMDDIKWQKDIRNKSTSTEKFCETPGCDKRPVYGGDYCAACTGGDA